MRWYALSAFTCLAIYFLAQRSRARSRSAARRNLLRHFAGVEGGQPGAASRFIAKVAAGFDRVGSSRVLRDALERSGSGLSWRSLKSLWVCALFLFPILAAAVTGSVLAVPPAAAVALAAPRFLLAVLRRKTDSRVREQCDRLSSDLALYMRCGIPIEDAIVLCTRDLEPPFSEALGRFQAEMTRGAGAGDALLAAVEPLECPDLELIVKAAITSRETGSDIRNIMDSVGEAVRERSAIRRELATQTVQGRMSGRVVAALPFLFLGLSTVISRETLAVLLGTVPGLLMLAAAAVLDGLGFLWLRRIMDIKT